jgi:hypothetical protein
VFSLFVCFCLCLGVESKRDNELELEEQLEEEREKGKFYQTTTNFTALMASSGVPQGRA